MLVLLGFDYGLIGCFCTIGMVYRSGVLVGCGGGVCRLGCWCGVVVLVVGRDGRRYPPSMVWGWDDKGVWNAEIFF